MTERSDEIAAWASLLGSFVALLGLIQSQSALVLAGVAFAGTSVAAILIAQRYRRALSRAAINIEGLNLDSLNVANLRRRLNRTLTVQRAYHLANIIGDDLIVAWQYDGYCRTDRETSIEFSVDTETYTPFADLDCTAYDLQLDPCRLHPIRPVLIGADGLSKKIAVPFLEPLSTDQPFRVILNCRLPGAAKSGIQYYTSTLSFDQKSIDRLAVHLVFEGAFPDWVRVYECDQQGRTFLIGQLRSFKNDGETSEFVDLLDKVPGQSIRVYVYEIATIPRLREASLHYVLGRRSV